MRAGKTDVVMRPFGDGIREQKRKSFEMMPKLSNQTKFPIPCGLFESRVWPCPGALKIGPLALQ
jgi:hypothetical protein